MGAGEGWILEVAHQLIQLGLAQLHAILQLVMRAPDVVVHRLLLSALHNLALSLRLLSHRDGFSKCIPDLHKMIKYIYHWLLTSPGVSSSTFAFLALSAMT